jgi:hypothetical protein
MNTHSRMSLTTRPRAAIEEDHAHLPFEKEHIFPEQLVFDLKKIVEVEQVKVERDAPGVPDVDDNAPVQVQEDYIKLDDVLIPLKDWQSNQFNDLGMNIERDETQLAGSKEEIVQAMNQYSYGVRTLPMIAGGALRVLTLNQLGKITIPEGHYGVVKSNGRYLFYSPGFYKLNKATHRFIETIPVDDERNPVRKYGDKNLLEIHANTLAGAHKIQGNNHAYQYVIFPRGRHVLHESEYTNVESVKLELPAGHTSGTIKLGPLTIAYISEGNIGCATRKKTGQCEVLYPGPPYILNEEEFVDIQVTKINQERFKLGPYEFVTVRDGYIGGAYDKFGGFIVLPPGNTYCLHEKEYDDIQLKQRSTKFLLGPYQFVTVLGNQLAGAYSKVTGEYVTLPPGQTYQLSGQEFYEANVVTRTGHNNRVGPLVYLTVPNDKLVGAFCVSDGKFIQFESSDQEYVLHDREYRDYVIIDKINYSPKEFGPNTVLTVRDGFVAIWEHNGSFKIDGPGNYLYDASSKLNTQVSLKVNTKMIHKDFRTKDGIRMRVKFTLIHNVTKDEALSVALYNGTIDDIEKFVEDRCIDNMIRLCNMYTRSDIRPTQQDMAMNAQSENDLDERNLKKMLEEAQKSTYELYESMETLCTAQTVDIVKAAQLGINVSSIKIDGFELMEENIMQTLNQITHALLETKAQKVQGELAVARAEAQKVENIKKAEATIAVQEREAKAHADIRKREQLNEAEIRKETALYGAEVRKQEAQADMGIKLKEAENQKEIMIKTETAEADAKSQAQLITAQAERDCAELKAESHRMAADAEFHAEDLRNKAFAQMPENKFKLLIEEETTKRAESFAQAAWVHPDKQAHLMEMFSKNPNIRFGELTLHELMASSSGGQGAVDTKKLPTVPRIVRKNSGVEALLRSTSGKPTSPLTQQTA